MRYSKEKKVNAYELVLVNANNGKSASLGLFETIRDISETYPIFFPDADKALVGLSGNWQVVFYALTGEDRREIPDPRYFAEDSPYI